MLLNIDFNSLEFPCIRCKYFPVNSHAIVWLLSWHFVNELSATLSILSAVKQLFTLASYLVSSMGFFPQWKKMRLFTDRIIRAVMSSQRYDNWQPFVETFCQYLPWKLLHLWDLIFRWMEVINLIKMWFKTTCLFINNTSYSWLCWAKKNVLLSGKTRIVSVVFVFLGLRSNSDDSIQVKSWLYKVKTD